MYCPRICLEGQKKTAKTLRDFIADSPEYKEDCSTQRGLLNTNRTAEH
jgi:hypothetical protein